MTTAFLLADHVQRAAATLSPGDAVMLGPDVRLTCEGLERLAGQARVPLAFTARSRERMAASAEVLAQAHARGEPIYGLTTGFGPHVCYSADEESHQQGAGLIAHLAAGWGPMAEPALVRAALIVRSQALAQGASGIQPQAAQALLDLLAKGVVPAIPCVGSVGASGDLIPLAHAARVLMGDGEVITESGRIPAAQALREAGLVPLPLSGRDALALVNGTAFMTGYAALALARAERLVALAEKLTGWIYRLLGARAQALDPRLHHARGHPGQSRSAVNILAEAERHGPWEDPSRPLQEVYSIRCAPQFLGACRDQLDHARALIEREINGVNDNPVIAIEDAFDATAQGKLDSPGAPSVLHGGNFQGQQIAFACDAINTALVQVGLLVERQIDVLVNPDLNGKAPLLLAWQPGATSGVAGAQITASAIAAEMRHHGLPAANATIPTNGRNQDVVSMGTLASRMAFDQTDRLAAILAIGSICAAQLNFLRAQGRAPGKVAQAPPWMLPFEPFKLDRPLHKDIERLAQAWLSLA